MNITGYQVTDNVTGQAVRAGLSKRDAEYLCCGLNLNAGPGSRYGVGPDMSARQITPDDIYALGLAVGNLLRDVDPAKRDRVLELIRTLERQAKR